MGGLIQFMPFTYTVMLIGTIALLGLPWLSGFYSKDLILELAYGKYQFSSIFAFILGTLTAFLTAFYSIRLINLVYLTMPNANKTSYLNIHAETSIVIIPLSILALFAIFLGFIASDFVSIGSDFFGNSLFYHPSHLNIIEAEFSLPLYIKLLPTVLSLLGGCLAIYIYHYGNNFLIGWTFPFYKVAIAKFNTEGSAPFLAGFRQAGEGQAPSYLVADALTLLSARGEGDTVSFSKGAAASPEKNKTSASCTASDKTLYLGLNNLSNGFNQALPWGGIYKARINSGISALFINSYTFLNGKYLLDNIYNNYIISEGLKLGFTISKLLDKGIIELIGPFGLTEGSYSASSTLSKLDSGVITTYALYITLGLISILFILFSPMFTLNELTFNVLEDTQTIASAKASLMGEDLSTVTIEQLKNNYTYSIKILLLSIFSTYIILSL
jgi:NADH:ubiquinone oxidoreductase subunit 5 (subunit L)/multisubunit Na+/H+ antiporter MnhA subunit